MSQWQSQSDSTALERLAPAAYKEACPLTTVPDHVTGIGDHVTGVEDHVTGVGDHVTGVGDHVTEVEVVQCCYLHSSWLYT